MNLEIINKLYLELSQIATAKIGSENYLEILLEKRDKDHAATIAQLQADNAKLREALEHTISLPIDGMYLFKVNKFYVEKVLGETKNEQT